MLSKSFKSEKCKTSLKLAVSRIKLLKNRKEIQVKQLRRELAQLLASGQEQTARIRVEHVIREEKTLSAYDLIEIYCELIVARLPIIVSQKSCPIDLREAISSVIFASPRCADISELADVRKQFVAKYGKEFATSALELRPDCGVSRMIVEKLSAVAPDVETKVKVLTAIAKEHDVKWDSKAFAKELQKPKEDLLNGSNNFTQMTKEPSNVSQTESTSKDVQTDTPSKQASFEPSSHTNSRTATFSALPDLNESRKSNGKASFSDVRGSYLSETMPPLKQPSWKMEFKDAASAAQAAAKSAEKANIAAKAAAQFASQENISRKNSNGANESSSVLGSQVEWPNRAASSKLTGDFSGSINMEDKSKDFQGTKKELNKKTSFRDGEEVSHHSSAFDENIEHSSQIDNMRTLGIFRESFSRLGLGFDEEKAEANYDRSVSSSSIGTLDDNNIWFRTSDKHQIDSHKEVGSGEEEPFRYYDKDSHVSSVYPAAVFDEYGHDENDDNENSFDKKQNAESSILIPSVSSVNSSVLSNSGHARHPVTIEKLPSSKFDNSIPAAFDGSDDYTSESDSDPSSFLQQHGTAQSSQSLHEKSILNKDSDSSGEEFLSLSSAKEKHLNHTSSIDHRDSEMPDELASRDGLGLNFGKLTGGLRNRGYSHPPPLMASSVSDSSASSSQNLGSTILSTKHIFTPLDDPFTSSVVADDSVEILNKGKSEDPSIFSSNQENSRSNEWDKPNSAKHVPFDSIANTSKIIDQKAYSENRRAKVYKELSSQMSKADFNSDDGVEERGDSQQAKSNSILKLSRRTKRDFTSKDKASAMPKSETKTFSVDRNKSVTSNMSAHEKIEKANEGSSVSSTSSVNPRDNEPSLEPKLQEASSQKIPHVHPKLPDYETLAAHFRSLRSNRRQL